MLGDRHVPPYPAANIISLESLEDLGEGGIGIGVLSPCSPRLFPTLVLFGDRLSFIPAGLDSDFVDQAGLALTKICLSLLSECWC